VSQSAAAARELAPEEAARAAIYGLIARLFYAAPDNNLLGQILHADLFEAGESAPARSWHELVAACRDAFPVLLENEHTELFVGTGKSEITPYLSHYVLKHANDNPLVELRQQLAAWGIGRREAAGEYEDHIAGVCETMQFAIAVQHRSIEEQKLFFEAFVYRGVMAFCDAVNASPKADFYRLATNFVRAFVELEHEAFDMI
jgi:TorA maturation chaperone TorD